MNDQRQKIDEYEVPDLLANLVDRSLVIVDGDTWRYELSESMRAFASEQLEEAHEMKRKHFECFLSHATRIADLYERDKEFESITLLEDELDNLRAAIDWGLLHDPKNCLHLVACLSGTWQWLGPYGVEAVLRKALAAAPDAVDKDHVLVKLHLASAKWVSDDEGSYELYREVLHMVETVQDPAAEVEALHGLSFRSQLRGEMAVAEEFVRRALEIAQKNHLRSSEARMHCTLGELARSAKDLEGAHAHYLAALDVAAPASYLREITLYNLASCALEKDDLVLADHYVRIACKDYLELAAKSSSHLTVDVAGYLFVMRGDIRRGGLLMGFTVSRLERNHRSMEPLDQALFDQVLAKGKTQGGEDFEQAFRAGQTMKRTDVVELIAEAL